jgi:hypothetical protein
MTGLIPAILADVITFAAVTFVSRRLGVDWRTWLPGGVVTGATVAALT